MALSISVRCTLLVIAILFASIFASCLPVRERLAARTGRSGGDYRAECGILTSIAFAEYLYHSHTNTGNNIADSSFCTGGWLFAVSVLGVAAIRRNLKNRRNAPPISVRCTLLIWQRTLCSESRAFGWRLPSRMPKPCKYRSCRIPIPFPHTYRKQRCPFRFLHRRMVVCCICSGSCCNLAKFEKAERMHRRIPVRCRLLVSRKTPCSESRAFGWRLPSRTPKSYKVHSCRTLIPFPYKYRKQRCPFQFLHRRTAVCCICFESCCNLAKFEKTKEMHRLFQYGARCLSVRKRFAARAERSGGDY